MQQPGRKIDTNAIATEIEFARQPATIRCIPNDHPLARGSRVARPRESTIRATPRGAALLRYVQYARAMRLRSDQTNALATRRLRLHPSQPKLAQRRAHRAHFALRAWRTARPLRRGGVGLACHARPTAPLAHRAARAAGRFGVGKTDRQAQHTLSLATVTCN